MKPEALPLRVLSLSLSMDLLAQLETLGQCMDQLGQEATRLPLPDQGLSQAAPAFERSMQDLQAACSRTLDRIAALQAALASEKASLRAQLLTLSLWPPAASTTAGAAPTGALSAPPASPPATPAPDLARPQAPEPTAPAGITPGASLPPSPARRKATRALRLQPVAARKRAP